MRVAGEKDYELTNGDSIVAITNNFHGLLNKALDTVGEHRPVHIRLMFEMFETGIVQGGIVQSSYGSGS